jgi:hypothetical protein
MLIFSVLFQIDQMSPKGQSAVNFDALYTFSCKFQPRRQPRSPTKATRCCVSIVVSATTQHHSLGFRFSNLIRFPSSCRRYRSISREYAQSNHRRLSYVCCASFRIVYRTFQNVSLSQRMLIATDFRQLIVGDNKTVVVSTAVTYNLYNTKIGRGMLKI